MSSASLPSEESALKTGSFASVESECGASPGTQESSAATGMLSSAIIDRVPKSGMPEGFLLPQPTVCASRSLQSSVATCLRYASASPKLPVSSASAPRRESARRSPSHEPIPA